MAEPRKNLDKDENLLRQIQKFGQKDLQTKDWQGVRMKIS